MCGVWRRPPPSHHWVSGEWKQLNEGWVWLRGFWYPPHEGGYSFIGETPPDALDEQVGSPPNDNYFWVPGHWLWNEREQEYGWLGGVWEELDPEWVLVPAHYVWREEGYIFIPSYWDYPAQRRGTAYKSVIVPPQLRHRVSYTPCCVWHPNHICRHLMMCYPDHLCFVHHCWHFHPNWWYGCDCIPSWWAWDSWWAFSWHEQWALWWWWGHPGFPQPWWMNPFFAGHIAPPGEWIFNMFSHMGVLLFVTPWGVLPSHLMLQALDQMGLHHPVLLMNDQLIQQLHENAKPSDFPQGKPLLPTGEEGQETNLLKPTLDPEKIVPSDRVQVPPKAELEAPEAEQPQEEIQQVPDRPEVQVVPIYPEREDFRPPRRPYYPKPRPRPRPRWPEDHYDPKPRPRPRPPYRPEHKWPDTDQDHQHDGDSWLKPKWPQKRPQKRPQRRERDTDRWNSEIPQSKIPQRRGNQIFEYGPRVRRQRRQNGQETEIQWNRR